MAGTGRLRRTISSFLLWGVFFCLYAGGAAILALGLIFTCKKWWALLHQNAGPWAEALKSGEVLLLAAGLLLVLIIPFLQVRGRGKVTRWNERESARRGDGTR